MKIKIRVAVKEDAEAFIDIKNQLPFKYSDGSTSKGGFLLGTDIDTYRKYIENDCCLVAEKGSRIVGFGIVLKNKSLRASDLWLRRHQASWEIDISTFDDESICYFEQLAFLHGYSREVIKLAYNLVCWAFEKHHTHLFTTTVREPILNLAAVPYILKGSGTKVGHINEVYPGIGRILSDIYKVEAVTMYNAVTSSVLYPFLKSNYIRF